eukprot:22578-Eustigmatos_ZCMA.PRE.1
MPRSKDGMDYPWYAFSYGPIRHVMLSTEHGKSTQPCCKSCSSCVYTHWLAYPQTPRAVVST